MRTAVSTTPCKGSMPRAGSKSRARSGGWSFHGSETRRNGDRSYGKRQCLLDALRQVPGLGLLEDGAHFPLRYLDRSIHPLLRIRAGDLAFRLGDLTMKPRRLAPIPPRV